MLAAMRQWARRVKRDLRALWLAARDPRVPMAAKIVAGLVAAYAFSPIDLIPDVIPVLGYLDDVVIVPLGVLLALRMIPKPLLDEHRATAETLAQRPISRAGAAVVVLLWLLGSALLLRWAWPWIAG